MPEIYGSDTFSPRQIADLVDEQGVEKARAPFLEMFMLAVLAGGFVGLGGLYATLLTADPELTDAARRALSGFTFAGGYIVAVLAGAQLFTSNNLLAMTWAARRISTYELLRNWGIVLTANAVGAFGLVLLFILAGFPELQDRAIGERAVEIARDRITPSFVETFALAVLGNLFVCIAVWISLGGKNLTDKIIAMFFPLSALGALDLEHVLASLYFIPRGLMVKWLHPDISIPGIETVTVTAFLANLVPVILGNIVGGTMMVAFVYYVVFRVASRDRH